jgi:hypothetical protein
MPAAGTQGTTGSEALKQIRYLAAALKAPRITEAAGCSSTPCGSHTTDPASSNLTVSQRRGLISPTI